MRRFAGISLLLGLAFGTACATGQVTAPVEPTALQGVRLRPISLSEEQFASSVAQLVRDGEASPERLSLLVAAVRWQLGRAGRYFAAGHESAALDAVMGALLLVRAGELRGEMFQGQESTLLQAAAALARRGDEGGAGALYELTRPLLPKGAAEKDVAGHLQALQTWQAATVQPGSMLEAGARRTTAAKRALLYRTPQNLEQAQRATANWVERSFAMEGEEAPPTTHDEFDERREAQAARIAGAPSMVALYLRDGDAGGAALALEGEPMEAVANAKLVERLNEAAEGDAEAWADMFGFYQSPKTVAQMGLDADLARGAAWGSALAFYRHEPDNVQAVMGLSALLAEHNMGDVATLLLDPALGEKPDPRALSWGLGLTLQAVTLAEQRGDLGLARRAYTNAERVVQLAGTSAYSGRVRPSAEEIWQAMGGLESRSGHLDQARPHLERVTQKQPNTHALRLLAAIDRQKGALDQSLKSLQAMLELAQRASDLGATAATWVMIYDLEHERGQMEPATRALAQALNAALQARTKNRTGGGLAAVERVLADVLERYGDREGANRAVERAEDAARNDHPQLTATVLDAARRALCMQDLQAGRRALRHAIDGDLPQSDLTYAALWVKLLQMRSGVPSDGSVEEALSRVDNDGTWIASLRDWGRGSLGNEQLLARAKSPIERVEAEFYAAIGSYVLAQNEANVQRLQAVAQSSAIELVEVRIARDLVLSQRGALRPTLPPGIEIP